MNSLGDYQETWKIKGNIRKTTLRGKTKPNQKPACSTTQGVASSSHSLPVITSGVSGLHPLLLFPLGIILFNILKSQ